MKLIALTILMLCSVFAFCQSNKSYDDNRPTLNERGVPQYDDIQMGGIKMITIDGKYQVWTKKVGNWRDQSAATARWTQHAT